MPPTFQAHKNLAISTVATAPTPAASGTTLTVATGDGTRFPTAPFQVTIWPAAATPTPGNAEVATCSGVAGDVLTLTRAQEGTTARTVIVGDQVIASITAKTITDIEVAFTPVVISAANLTANANDFAPTGHAGASVIRVSGDTAFRVITGIAGGFDGRLVTVVNTGSNSLLLRGASADSAAANRFSLGGNGLDVPLFPGQLLELVYDTTALRWRCLTDMSIPPGLGFEWRDDMFSPTVTDRWIAAQNSGTGTAISTVNATDGHPGIVSASTGTTATGRSGFSSGGLGNLLLAGSGQPQYYRYDAIVRVPVLSTAAQRFVAMLGLSSLNTGEPANGLYFYYRDDLNSGGWALRSRKASVNTDRATAAIAAATWYHLALTLGPDNVARGFVNGTQVGADIAASMTADTASNWMWHILKSVGTTASTLEVDATMLTTYMARLRA